jgi:hypothetical protein
MGLSLRIDPSLPALAFKGPVLKICAGICFSTWKNVHGHITPPSLLRWKLEEAVNLSKALT